MNPATYQNMNSDNVDWAALAQQWIKMKEAAPATPPPPNLQDASQSINTRNEVPMDMDGSDDGVPPAPPAPTISGSENWNQWNQWENQWNQSPMGSNLTNWEWNNGRSAQKALKTPNIPNTAVIAPPAPMISTCPPFANQCVVPPTIPQVPPPHSYTYNALPATHSQFSNQMIPNEFWSNEPHSETSASLAKNMHDLARMPFGPMGIDIPKKRDIRDTTPEDDLSITLDTVKRRQLPAWIREGLEKMEREKQKAIEREQLEALRLKELENKKISEEEARAVLDPAKSKFDTDSDQEVTEFEMEDEKKPDNLSEDQVSDKDKYEKRSPDYVQPRKTRFKDASSPVVQSNDTVAPIINEKVPDTIPQQAVIYQSKEEMLQNMMLKVRRSLTEILLEVTNDEIGSVCKDVWKRFCSKGKTTTNAGPAVLSQLSRKLGLGIYSDSNSESDEERATNNDHVQPSQDDDVESDEEIMKNLRQRQVAFRMTEAEIEARLAEEEKNDDEDDEKSDESEKNQHTKRNNSNLSDELNSLATSSEKPKISRERVLSESSNSKRERKSSDGYDSPSLQSTSHHSSTKKNSKHSNNKNSNNKMTRASSSRSRSKSKSSREGSSEHRTNEYLEKKNKKKDISKHAEKLHKTRSRSSSRSRRKNHSRERSCSKSSSRSKHKYKKSRSRSTSKRRRRSRSRHKSRSRRKKSVSPSHSSSRSRSRSSTSHKESRSSYSRNSYERDTGSKRRRESRSRSIERKRRSVSSSRSSKKRRDKSYREKKSKKSHRY
ncbi:arginine/serine-rich protein PNISR [Trichogramma pretiosum]|uniref:arginine/serine-rich protein PNISR n=1 Tax=Trichogramma pretiosum TaxID=7493 RepID=UPI0006C97369|nr:arginine/serine-rich protein PNISR [Trichogramma pretiosum]XP_014220449.1 arginine/serine-rich protein PNISR [Trichogramma pretiosum]XP_014220450.1 arginine/serine-rich protein PNISR [Trichogramma pretiosum]XP_023314074.1 arginine/serine-rich protein PNISR [Trichogramma pretiosum]